MTPKKEEICECGHGKDCHNMDRGFGFELTYECELEDCSCKKFTPKKDNHSPMKPEEVEGSYMQNHNRTASNVPSSSEDTSFSEKIKDKILKKVLKHKLYGEGECVIDWFDYEEKEAVKSMIEKAISLTLQESKALFQGMIKGKFVQPTNRSKKTEFCNEWNKMLRELNKELGR